HNMKIALSTLSGISYGGVTFYINLIPALSRADISNQYIIFSTKKGNQLFGINNRNFKCVIVNNIVKYPIFRFFWEQCVLPFKLKKMNIDIYYSAKNINILFSPVKTIIAIRNMEPFFYKQYINRLSLNIYSFLRYYFTRISMIRANKIIVVSEYTKKYLGQNYPNIKHKLHLVYNGNPVLIESRNNKKIYQVKGDYILTASKFVPYANQLSLLKGYNYLNNQIDDLPPLW
ncbi:uncharacterized protein METZ01_LOCUS511202, partial [marine metagenome]